MQPWLPFILWNRQTDLDDLSRGVQRQRIQINSNPRYLDHKIGHCRQLGPVKDSVIGQAQDNAVEVGTNQCWGSSVNDRLGQIHRAVSQNSSNAVRAVLA